jgi:hypothetical protein
METMEIVKSEESTPQQLLNLAITKGADVAQLEKLMEFQERWEANKARKTFLAAISKFQSEVPVIEKKRKVLFGNTKYSYAELGEIAQAIQKALTANGLSYRWEIADNETGIACTCIVSQVDGHSERTTMTAGSDKSGNKPEIQARASSISYLQRYTLIGALGLTTAAEDTDVQELARERQEAKAPSESQTAKKEQPQASTGTGKVTPNAEAGDVRPWLSEKQFEQATRRITEGDAELYLKLDEEFRMKRAYRDELKPLHELSLTLKREPVKAEVKVETPEEYQKRVQHSFLLCQSLQELEEAYNKYPEYFTEKWFQDIFNSTKINLTSKKK